MSRHTIPALRPGLEVSVGWDRPLASFYGQVFDPTIDDEVADPIILWIGGGPGEVATVEALAAALAPQATLEPEMLDTLREDCAREGVRPAPRLNLLR